MQAIILAAGLGKRLGKLTENNTKCMVKVNGITIIERLLRILEKKDISRIIIVDGYKSENLRNFISTLNISVPILYIHNPIFEKTNNIYSLGLAKEYLIREDTLLFESDLVFEEGVIDSVLDDERTTLALVDKYESWMDGTCMTLDQNDCIVDFIPGKYIKYKEKEEYYKTVNIYKFSKHFSEYTYVPFLEAYTKAVGNNEYYESVIKLISLLETKEIRAKRLTGQLWYEIDDVQDLDIAETIFLGDEKEKYLKLSHRYGGYWRFPKLLDFCYLVNPYFPSSRMLQEINSNSESLIRCYPSGMDVNCLLASRNFGISREYVVVGNGAAELIKNLTDTVNLGKLGIIRPTFEEYPNRYDPERTVVYTPDNEDYSYTAGDLIDYFGRNKIETLILVNPDNPTGNYISYDDLTVLMEWTKSQRIRLVVDESFLDFVGIEMPQTLIKEKILEQYEDLFVIKSISKSYGVPGLRLGILASSNIQVIKKLKKNAPIWNINSIAEYYMQIYKKYEKDYQLSLENIKHDREKMIRELDTINMLRVIPSQANYVCCEVVGNITADKLAFELLNGNILIKVLTPKMDNGKEYIRLAVRTEEENHYLTDKIKEVEKRYE